MVYTKEKIEQLRHRWATTKGKRLLKTIKNSRCYLSPTLFRQKIHGLYGINDPEVEDGIDLRGANLSGFDFRVSVQEDDEGFYEDIAILSHIHFEGAILRHCDFKEGKIHDCNFEGAELAHCDFANSAINSCNFQEADCIGMNLNGAKLVNCNFYDASIKDVRMDSTLVDEKTTFGKHLKSEKEGNYHFAAIEYKQIKEMNKNSSLHGFADHYHYKEMIAKRRSMKLSNPVRWINFIFGDLLCGYGTSFLRVFVWSGLIMFFCAFLYYRFESLLFYNKDVYASFADSIYFSMATFTTLGYGDFHAVGWLRYLTGIESFIGAAMMSLFTVIVARNIIRD